MKISTMRFIPALCLMLIFSITAFSQEASSGWKVKLENAKAFIENQGQFNHPEIEGSILFAYDDAQTKIYFTEKGTAYSFVDMKRFRKNRNINFTSFEDWFEYDKKPGRYDVTLDFAAFKWESANLGVDIIPSDLKQDYFSYCYKDTRGEVVNRNFIKGYKTLTYKNIYSGIDIVYTFHPSNGIKYTIIVHPGADPSKIKMNFTEIPTLDALGNLHVETVFGDIIDHAPVTYYQDSPDQFVKTAFELNQNMVTFNLENYDNSRTLIIDPWVQTPTLNISNGVWECERDGAGNVYIIGGDMPMRLLKYNSAGTLQWTYTTPWDTTNSWLGTFATDLAGNSYVTSGSIAELQKINSAGGMVYYNNAPLLSGDEYWNISFNCDQTKLIIGGTSGVAFPMIDLWGAIFDINTSNGAINSVAHIGSMPSMMELQEVRSLTSCKNARYYYLLHDTLGCIDQNFGACPSNGPSLFEINSTYYLSYKSETYRPNNGNAGIMSIRANPSWLYSTNGTNIHQRQLSNGAIVGAAAIPGGSSVSTFGHFQIENSGLEIDTCGNVYAGSTNCVAKYDESLNLITTYPTLYRVSDLTVTNNGNLIIAGTTGDNSWTVPRTGYVEYINMSTCNPLALICCDANICPPSPVCTTDPQFTLSASTSGGLWSGTGIVDPNLGIFEPAGAGPGAHWVYYTLPCGTDSVQVVVNLCAQVNICQELNGDLSVSGGSGPYTWYVGSLGTDCSQCLFAPLCFPAAANCPLYLINWTLLGTGTSITPTGDTICVVDGYSNSDTTFFYGALPQCGICPDLSAASSNVVNATCNGATDGSFFVSVPAGTAPFDYTLDQGGTTVAQFLNTGNSQAFTGLGAGTYTLYITDNDNCGDTISITITEPAPFTVSISGTLSFCAGSNTVLTAGAGYSSYQWSTTETTQTIVVTSGGTYSVTVTNGSGCPGTDEVIVTEMTAADATITSGGPFCVLDGPTTLTAVDGGGTWAGTGITDANAGTFDPSIAGVGSYPIIYTITGTCGDADTITIDVVSIFDATITSAGPFCSNDDTIHLTAADPGGSWFIDGVAGTELFDPAVVGPGAHEIIYSIPGSCGDVDTSSILVYQAPSLGGGATPETCEDADDGTIILLINSGTPPFTASWSNGDTGTELDSLMPGIYNVTVADSNGCQTATVFSVLQSDISCYDPIVYVPNIFTPNGDGTNDILFVRGRGIETMQFIIYDRWGERVFTSEDPEDGWDGTFRGKPMESAVFVWHLKATLSNDESIKWKGTITLIK